jgi:fluoride ion exporter CrcB/FEX
MKTKLSRVGLVLAAGLSGLALAASAAGTTASGGRVRVVLGPVQALTLAGTRVVYSVGANATSRNGKPFEQRTEVLVWDLKTGKTTKVSGTGTASAGTLAWGGVIELAVAGSRVAWLTRAGGNSEADDDLFTSSLLSPKERHVAGEVRYGDACGAGASGPPACAGNWLGGVVGAGSRMLVNRWTTDTTHTPTQGGLYALNGTKFKPIVRGLQTVEAVDADQRHVAVLHPDGTIGLYSTTGTLLLTVRPSSAEGVALSGRNLVVLTRAGNLQLFNAQTGNRFKTLPAHGSRPGNLDVQGHIAIYTTGSSVHAVNLLSRKDRVIGTLPGGVEIARIGTAGVAYASSRFYPRGTLVVLPFARVATAVS